MRVPCGGSALMCWLLRACSHMQGYEVTKENYQSAQERGSIPLPHLQGFNTVRACA